MHLYEMIGIADENGKTYISPYGTYSKKDGFDLRPVGIKHYYDFEKLLYQLVHEDCWRLKVDKKKMTKADIEKVLGYEIDIIDDDVSDNVRTYCRSYDEILKRVFGEN